LAAVAVAAFLLGTMAGPMFAGSALAPITLQPGQQITIIAADLPTPTPAPTPTPTPMPTPTPNGTLVPSNVNSTGTADAAAALNSWIATVPNGSTIVFKAGGIYRLDSSILLAGRSNLTFEGNGSTLRANATGSASLSSPFRLNPGNSGIVIRDFTIVGNNPNVTTLYTAGQEDQMGVLIYGSSNIEVAHNTISHTWGDGVYVGANNSTHAPSDGISIHDNTFAYIGRQGVALIASTNVLIEHNSFDRVGIHVLDIEPDLSWQVNHHITFRNNTVGSYSWSDKYVGLFVAMNGAGGTAPYNVTVTGNTVAGNATPGYPGEHARGINADSSMSRAANIVFTNNTTTLPVLGTVFVFQHVDGLTITGNVQPLASGSLAWISDCTSVTGP
jgi:hypothetical protein